VGQLSDVDTRGQNITLEEDGEMLTGRRAANRLADNYANESDVPVSHEHQRRSRKEQTKEKA